MPLNWPDPAQANTKDDDTRAVLLQEYSDRGQWARHYSTVRMTLGTFFITAATGVITLRWESPQLAIAIFAGVIFLIGVFLFLVFTFFTFREMSGQFKIVDSYREKLGATPHEERRRWVRTMTGWPLALVFLIAFAYFDIYWLFCSKP